MKHRFCTLQLVIFIFCSCLATLHAKELRMVTVDWAPYYGSEMTNNGVITVIVKAAFQRSGIQSSVKFIPWKRALKEVESGKSDILMGAYYTDERSKTYLYSEPIYDIRVGLVALKSLGLGHYTKLQDLTPYTIGVGRGWANSDEFDQADYLNKKGATNQILNVRKLFKKRVDMISISYDVFRYEVAAMATHTLDEVVFIEPPLQIAALHLMTSRQNPDKEKVINAFNRGLAAIKQDGTYDKILKEYGF
ncbi:substrate-binding periplasmic protein [Psychromonas ossibalaenae]|uniref:substrate-binding periplasmic protein n=1 Tax=Psychromonas ossibalaenae TaxID=444922 RepID=UPI0003649C61|nr:transporter substrate-binding domain-containing protein [Psychromonas ossibalaenae]